MPAHVLKLLSAATGDTPDADLLARFVAARDEAAFAELVRRHGPGVYRACRRLVGPSLADDAFQSTFLVLACRARAVRKAASVGSWLIGVAGRVARQMRRRDRLQASRDRQGAVELTTNPPPGGRGSLEATELASILADELTRLPDALRSPVVLCLVDGQTQEQAAAALGGSVRTLRRRLERAKALLRLRLERRGVVPTVAAGLVASLGAEATALPSGLADRAVNGVFTFLTGGPTTPAVVVAKGVVGSMAKLKASALVAAAAAVMIGLGMGSADDGPPRVAPPAPTKPAAPVPATPPAGVIDRNTVGVFTHRTANFVVTAPTAVIARVVATEAEFQRKALAERWLGGKLPDWPRVCPIRVKFAAAGSGGATTFTFPTDGKPRQPGFTSAEMDLHGSFEYVLTTALPHEVAHTVLAAYFGKPVPRWADEGIALMSESPEEQARFDARCRQLVQDGTAIRLRTLFPMTEYPKDVFGLHAQGHSVCRFLVGRKPRMLTVDNPGGQRVVVPAPPKGPSFVEYKLEWGVIAFLHIGMDGKASDSWAKAAKQVYGFESVDQMEQEWIEWLKTPASKPKPDGPSPWKPTRSVKPLPGETDLIPPTTLPEPKL